MKKKILILGVGEAQLNLIREAKQQGYYVIVCDMREEMEGAKLADKFYKVNYMDKEALLEIAEIEEIDGVISNSEPAMLNVAYLSEKLCVPGNSVKSVEMLISKTKFRELQKKIGVFSPVHYIVSNEEELIEKLKRIKYPVIIKPVESSGTRGTTKLVEFDKEIAKNAYQICKEFSRNNLVAVEEYIEMKNLITNGAEIFVCEGEVLWDGIYAQKRVADAPMIPMAEIFPSQLKEDEVQKVKEVVNRIIKESKIRFGEYNVEWYFTQEDEVFVIEINPRQGGNNLPLLVKEYSGVDFTRLLVTTAVKDMSYYSSLDKFKRENNFITQQVIFSKKDSSYSGLYIDSKIQPYVKWIKENYNIGDKISKGKNAADAVAFVDLQFENNEQQQYFTDAIENYIYSI